MGMKTTARLGLVIGCCWGCGGAPEEPVDDWYDIPVAAPSPPGSGARDLGAESAAGAPMPSAELEASDEPASSPDGAESSERAAGGPALRGVTAAGELSEPELYDALAQASAVCFGETHDDALHHLAQARAARALALRAQSAGVPFALGFEMFQTPFQAALTGFTLGALDERQLLRDSQYGTRWGYDFGFYRPLLELAREYRLPALALNAPAELTGKIADGGLEALSAEERAALPELELNDAEHRAYVLELLGTFHASEAELERPYTVQVVWDETMADTAADWLASSGDDARVLVIAGLGHCHRSAIPERIARRTGLPALAVAPVRESRRGAPGFPTLEHYDVLVAIED